MKLLLLLCFFVAWTHAAYTVVFTNKCSTTIVVQKTGEGPLRYILLSPGETRDDVVNTAASVSYNEPGTVAMFGVNSVGNFISAALGPQGTARSAKLVSKCTNCPVLWCESAGCKKTGDANFSNWVNIDVPAIYPQFDITYCY